MREKKCRFCGTPLEVTFADLGMSPIANNYIQEQDLEKRESFYPLHAYVCTECFLVQLEEFETPEQIFSDYAYFSSYSESWLQHAKVYAEQITYKLGLNPSTQVIEIASNDGYLLQYFKEKAIPVLGIEPAANVAEVAKTKGIPTEVDFFGRQLAQHLVSQGIQADLLLGNNVLAHVPDLNDFVGGMQILLKPDGVITMEFPHVLNLMNQNQFDTIYHEHFSYFSLITVQRIFHSHGLTIFDVEELNTHGGSLRIYAQHQGRRMSVSNRVKDLLDKEIRYGLNDIQTYRVFHEKIKAIKRDILDFLIQAKRSGKTVVGYGAPAKGNTLLNYCGIRTDFLEYTVDLNPYKQTRYLPGTHVPIKSPDAIIETKPDYVLILPWNIKEEIMQQMHNIREWGGKFVVPIPKVTVY